MNECWIEEEAKIGKHSLRFKSYLIASDSGHQFHSPCGFIRNDWKIPQCSLAPSEEASENVNGIYEPIIRVQCIYFSFCLIWIEQTFYMVSIFRTNILVNIMKPYFSRKQWLQHLHGAGTPWNNIYFHLWFDPIYTPTIAGTKTRNIIIVRFELMKNGFSYHKREPVRI